MVHAYMYAAVPFQTMCSQLTWSMSSHSCRWWKPFDGFMPFSGQELHSVNNDMISFIHTHTHAGMCFLYLRLQFALYLKTAITTCAAALNRLPGLRWEEGGGDGRTPIVAIRHNVACSHSWKPPKRSSRYRFWYTKAFLKLSARR